MATSVPASFSALRPFLDRGEVLQATVDQLRKDLAVESDRIPVPEVGEGAFEELRTHVLPVLEELRSTHGFQVAMYRVDIPEKHLLRSMETGGMRELAGEVVLRCLQKVLTRLRHSGRG